MNDLIVASSNGAVTMSSREIADLTDKKHQHVKRDIENMLIELGKDVSSFGRIYFDSMNRQQTEYHLDKELTETLITGYSIKLRNRVIKRLHELESRQHVTLPQTYAEALLEAGRLAQIAEEQSAQLAIAAPKVEFVDRYVEAAGLKGFRQVAKLLGANEARFREFLVDRKIMYRLGGEWTAYDNHIDAGRFDVKTGSSDTGHAFNQTKFTAKGVNWIAGLWAQHNLQEVA